MNEGQVDNRVSLPNNVENQEISETLIECQDTNRSKEQIINTENRESQEISNALKELVHDQILINEMPDNPHSSQDHSRAKSAIINSKSHKWELESGYASAGKCGGEVMTQNYNDFSTSLMNHQYFKDNNVNIGVPTCNEEESNNALVIGNSSFPAGFCVPPGVPDRQWGLLLDEEEAENQVVADSFSRRQSNSFVSNKHSSSVEQTIRDAENLFLGGHEEEEFWNAESLLLNEGSSTKMSKWQRKQARKKEKKNLPPPLSMSLRSQDL